MYRQLSNIALVLATAIGKARATMTDAWWTAMGDQTDKYRPEVHYMRGPGPKWREKHARVSVHVGSGFGIGKS
jgi:hypothetical protein